MSSSQAAQLSDAKSLHKASVNNEVVIDFSHVTKTYNLYKKRSRAVSGHLQLQKARPVPGQRKRERRFVVSGKTWRGRRVSGPERCWQEHGAEDDHRP